MRNKLEKLMMISEEGQKFTSKQLIQYLDLPDSNQSYKILAQLMKEFEDYFIKCQITYHDENGRHCAKGYKLYSNPYLSFDVEDIIDDTVEDTVEEEYYTINENTLKREILDIVATMKHLYFFADDIDDKYCLEMAKYSFKDSYKQLQVLIQ